jgi:hypothetical protein
MRFHVNKTVLISQTADGETIANHHIRIDGHLLVPAPPSASVEYLGALLRLDLCADAVCNRRAARGSFLRGAEAPSASR